MRGITLVRQSVRHRWGVGDLVRSLSRLRHIVCLPAGSPARRRTVGASRERTRHGWPRRLGGEDGITYWRRSQPAGSRGTAVLLPRPEDAGTVAMRSSLPTPAPGGQAGTTSMIENYLAVPARPSAASEWPRVATAQARRFGAGTGCWLAGSVDTRARTTWISGSPLRRDRGSHAIRFAARGM